MRPGNRPLDGDVSRGLSPVVGVVLLVAVALLLSAVVSAFALGLGEPEEPAPTTSLAVEPVDGSDRYRLVHRAGDPLSADRVDVRGGIDPNALSRETFRAGHGTVVRPVEDSVEVVWYEGPGALGSRSTYVLAEFDVDPGQGGDDCFVSHNGDEYESVCVTESTDGGYSYDYEYNYTYDYRPSGSAVTGVHEDESGSCDPAPDPGPDPPGDSDSDPDPDPSGPAC